jgi:hypothetical protein
MIPPREDDRLALDVEGAVLRAGDRARVVAWSCNDVPRRLVGALVRVAEPMSGGGCRVRRPDGRRVYWAREVVRRCLRREG